jgi:hypothetical protein
MGRTARNQVTKRHLTMSIKLTFLANELGILAWGASVQRAHLYQEGIDSSAKEVAQFRSDVTKFLSGEMLPQYQSLVTEDQHYRNLDCLIERASILGKSLLGIHGYKYGVAQKLLNLMLKYHWCLGLAAEPPHCPVDRIVISKTKFKGKINWTHITNQSQYKQVIQDVQRLAEAKGLSIAEWELTCYSRRSAANKDTLASARVA